MPRHDERYLHPVTQELEDDRPRADYRPTSAGSATARLCQRTRLRDARRRRATALVGPASSRPASIAREEVPTASANQRGMRSLPVACAPSAFSSTEAAEHHFAEGRRLRALILERAELPDGWSLRFPNEDDVFLALARWSAEERRCCPFFTFTLERAPADNPILLRVTGPDGAKGVLTAGLASERG
jgi:hypothetical protein